MPHVGFKIGRKTYTVEEALAAARRDGHLDNFPPSVFRAITREREGSFSLTASGATGCKRQRLLRVFEPYVLTPADELRALVGTAFHTALETDSPDDELFLAMPLAVTALDGSVVEIPLRLRIDHIDREHRRIVDFKTTGPLRWKDRETKQFVERELPKEEHVIQIQLGALVARHHGYEIDEGGLWYVSIDTSNDFARAATIQRRYVAVPIWDADSILMTAEELAQPLADALVTGQLPPPVFATIPADRKSAGFPCGWCPVFDACVRRVREGDETIPAAVIDEGRAKLAAEAAERAELAAVIAAIEAPEPEPEPVQTFCGECWHQTGLMTRHEDGSTEVRCEECDELLWRTEPENDRDATD